MCTTARVRGCVVAPPVTIRNGNAEHPRYLEVVTSLGFLAGVLTTASFLPQVLRSAKRRSAAGFSWLWLGCFGLGVGAWFAYGIFRRDPAMIGANGLTLLAVIALIVLRVRHGDGHAGLDAHALRRSAPDIAPPSSANPMPLALAARDTRREGAERDLSRPSGSAPGTSGRFGPG